MSIQTARRVITGSNIITGMIIVSAVLLAYWRLIDGAAAIATILASAGISGGTNAAVQASVPNESKP
jgi:hypothetical protein